jgi:hypothetical protein
MSETVTVKVRDTYEIIYYEVNGATFEKLEDVDSSLCLICRFTFPRNDYQELHARHQRNQAAVNLEELRMRSYWITKKINKEMAEIMESKVRMEVNP